MEEWQTKHITKNLPQLIPVTEFNVMVKAELVAQNILSKADVDKLNALQTQHGQSVAFYEYYQFLMGRINAYKVLTKALHENRQSGAARILIDGVPMAVSGQPMTYLGIPINWDALKDMEIEVKGRTLMLNEFLPNVNYEKLQHIFQETVSELEIYDTFVTKQGTFILAHNTVPPKPPFYVPRFLSTRIKINESVFKADCPDVFVFKMSIPRYKLSQIAKPHFTETSSTQLTKTTCRFIYLEENEDWIELKKIAGVPIHLINYKGKINRFLLEDSSAPSNILKQLGSLNDRFYMTEEDFVQHQLSENCVSSSVCICDTPGMGKTYLLANVARLMAEKCTGRLVVFIPLATFFKDFSPDSTNTIQTSEASLRNVLKFVLPTGKNPDLLLKLVQDQLIKMEIFFDGFDEIPSEKVDWTKQFFQSITTNFPNNRIYITSRLHMRQELEERLGVVAYDILPFNLQNQVQFLVQFWKNVGLNFSQCLLQDYATSCLEIVNQSLTKDDKEIAGIPLLCQLIADVYADKVAFRSIKAGRFYKFPVQISGMYQKFIEKRINLDVKNKEEFELINLVHVWHVLRLIFPENNFHDDKLFANVKDLLTSPKILRMGILQKHSNGALEFIHRTFAEYLITDYFSEKLQHNKRQRTEKWNCTTMTILKLLLEYKYTKHLDYEFVHPVIVSFFNSALEQINISDELNIQRATFISSISHKRFVSLLIASCRHNLLNLFSFLRESLTTWEHSRLLELFSNENSYMLLSVCIRHSNSHMFHSCVQLLSEELMLDMTQINIFKKGNTLLQRAVRCANYEAVEYLVDRISLQNQELLLWCIEVSYEIEKKRKHFEFTAQQRAHFNS